MTTDHTQYQSDEDERKTRELSLHQTRPPTTVPGYELTQFLGSGAYGEVWIGVDCSTGRKVAVKFYRDRNRVDWSQLSREVEKLVFLSADRYVVQLLSVGWNADPPYYVMEYIEQGSLEQLLTSAGPRSIGQAVELFREIVIGLNHAHAKGVMHCDLKPANVLLDLDGRPRLADFGQSRLSHEQTPSLGTLFYMSPEQADLEAVPDVQWDVYALGAILYCMLTGRPPHQSDEISKQIQAAANLSDRLRLYRQWITSRDRVNLHRQIRGVDTALAAIADRCLAAQIAAICQRPGDTQRTRIAGTVAAPPATPAAWDRGPLIAGDRHGVLRLARLPSGNAGIESSGDPESGAEQRIVRQICRLHSRHGDSTIFSRRR